MRIHFLICVGLLAASIDAASAGGEVPGIAQPTVPVPQVTLPTLPQLGASMELKGAALLKALRAGGLLLYARHTETGKGSLDCSTSNLSPLGEAQATQLGAALRKLNIPLGERESSELCRAQDTARLLDVGPFRTNEDLNNSPKRPGHDFHAARLKRLGVAPPPGTNSLLVGHMQGGNTPDQRILLDLGEVIVLRPNGKGGSDAIARIRLSDWAAFDSSRQD
jgi:hypothetical protein